MKIKDLIKNQENWCKEVCFKDKNGLKCNLDEAVCFCLLGAIDKVYGKQSQKFAEICEIVVKEINTPISIWNDNHNHADILALVEKLDI